MNKVDLSGMGNLDGRLIGLSDNSEVEVVSLALSSTSIGKVAEIVDTGRIERKNQNNLVVELCIREEGQTVFESGQSPWQQRGSMYVMTNQPSNPKHFKAVFKCAAPAKNTSHYIYVCELELGNVTFDLSHCAGVSDGNGEVVYENVPMMLYPGGRYTTRVVE